MRKNKVLLVLLFGLFLGSSVLTFVQHGECVFDFETTLAYGENRVHDTTNRVVVNKIFESVLAWSFVGNNSNVAITVKQATSDPNSNTSGSILSSGRTHEEGEMGIFTTPIYLVFWHLDETAQGESTTLRIQLSYTPFYYGSRMILIYIGSFVFLVVLTVTIVVTVRLQKKKKKQHQETIPTSSDEETKIFCWKCGQPNTTKNDYCSMCKANMQAPEK